MFDDLVSDHNSETAGIWRTWTDGKHEIDFQIARAGGSNKAFKVLGEQLTRKHRRAGVDIAQLDPDKSEDVLRELYARTVVMNWRGEYIASKGIEFSAENCMALFKAQPSCLYFVVNEATSNANYVAAILGVEAKN